MKRILYIARNELHNLYFSPIAWTLMVLFLILTLVDYFNVTEILLGYFENGGVALQMTNNLTNSIISHPMIPGYFVKIVENLYIFFPLITMGLISREISSGTMKLLHSSPIRISEIVVGKFLAMVFFSFTLIFLVLLSYISLSLSLSNPDYEYMFFVLAGLFLVLCTYAAIGLFISSLTSYPIVAAIITFAVFAFFSKVGDLWQDVDIIRNIAFYLNISGKSTVLINGLFNTRDVFYFLILIATFLIFTIIKIKSATASVSGSKKMGRYLVILAGAFITGLITSRPALNVYYDATRDKVNTITSPTQKVLAQLNEDELDITVFANLLGEYNSFDNFKPKDENNIISSIWEPYIRFKPNINVKFVYYYNTDSSSSYLGLAPGKSLKEIAEKQAASFNLSINRFLSPDKVRKLIDVEKEGNRSFFVLKYKGKTAIVRTFDDPLFWPTENEIAAALNRLIDTSPKIIFLSDEIERGPFSRRPRDLRSMASSLGNRSALINQGYDFDTLSLRNRAAIPLDIAALAISDPRIPFSPESLRKIRDYIAAGGNLFIAGEPDKKDIIKPLFDELGLSQRPGLLIQSSDQLPSNWVSAYISETGKNLTPQFNNTLKDEARYSGDTMFKVYMPGANALDYQEKQGFRVVPLLSTNAKLCWNRTAPISEDSLQMKVPGLPNDEHGKFVTAVLMERDIKGKNQRIIAASDADYLTGDAFSASLINYEFGFSCFSYFSYGRFPANTLRPQTDNSFRIKVASLSAQKAVYYYIIPAIIIVIASVILIRRKRK